MSAAQHVHLDEGSQTYVIEVDGQMAGYAEFQAVDETVRDFNHTVVLNEYRGQGLSSPLIRYALDDSIRAGMTIVPSCSAVEHFISKNPEYREHLAR
ncbi:MULTISPECIES: GNAT family N-acetyltransferase [unclassified Corynebacterium]|uniref:GNAT family N-acetyltransferase n=1 Tax=unclassified Corynebacterium TaxID=2624378 RepID=UPI001C44CF7D|nr:MULTISPECIES: GNAT family N-acetyltransferase [unclassified Corynebacterium]MBV7282680.1 N-acetyltransferase [Corynebacterium sp. TAE3-ERU30]MBV7301972.1 N-acetyltransferase [Corynebacterium sp. TAE3-ERU2]